MPHQVGTQVVFGLDGAYLGSSFGYPLGGSRHWWEVDAAGARVREFDAPFRGNVQQSPDGMQFTYANLEGTGPESRATYVRDTVGGTARVLAIGDANVGPWIDNDHVMLTRAAAPGVIWSIDTRSLVETVVFREPAPPSPRGAGEYDWYTTSGDLRWAVMVRYRADDSILFSQLYDVRRQAFVRATLPLRPTWLSPRDDLLVWFESGELRGMHLCDQRIVSLAALPRTATPIEAGVRWSPDGRYLSFAYGHAYEEDPPERVVLADLVRGTVAQTTDAWGFVRAWSPRGDVVVLSRFGYHSTLSRLAQLTMP